VSLADLRQAIDQRFSIEELKTLCFDLELPDEQFASGAKDAFIRKLILCCRHHDDLGYST
jgi:hypothetical protein